MRFSNFSVMMFVIGAATAAPPTTRQLRGSGSNNNHYQTLVDNNDYDYDESYKVGGVSYEDNFDEDYELDDLDKEIAIEDYEEEFSVEDEEEMVTRSSVFKGGYDEESDEEVILYSNDYEENDKEDYELHNNNYEDYDESDDEEESESFNFMNNSQKDNLKSAFYGAGTMTNEEDMMNSYDPNNENMMNSYDEEFLINSEYDLDDSEEEEYLGNEIMSNSAIEKSNYDTSGDLEYFSIDEDDEEEGIRFRSSAQQNEPKLNIDDEETMMMARSDRDSYDEVSEEEDYEIQNNNNYGENYFFDDLDKEIADEDYEYNEYEEEEEGAYDNVEEDWELHNNNYEEEEAYDESDEGEIEMNLNSAFHGVGTKTNHYLNIKEEEENLLRQNDWEESVEYKEREMKINALEKAAEEKKNEIKEELNVKMNALKEEEMEEIKNIEMDAFNKEENIMKTKAAANNVEEEERIYYHE